MSNHDDFWTTLATKHTNTVLSGAMDTHLSGKSLDESFGSVRDLTDKMRSANALPLPVEAGTKVVFAGGMGAYLAYENPPVKGATGEVVTVKSATGNITYHDGKVFVQWDDGDLRTIHADHLRLAKQGKTAGSFAKTHPVRWSSDDMDAMKLVGYFMVGPAPEAALRWMAGGEAVPRVFNDEILAAIKLKFDYGSMRSDVAKKVKSLEKTLRANPGDMVDKRTGEPIGRTASDLKADFEKIKALAEAKPDNDFLKSLLKQMADKGFAPTDKQMKVVDKIEKEVDEMGEMQKELKALTKKGGRMPLPGEKFEVTSNYTDIAGMGQYNSTLVLKFIVNDDGSASLMERGKPSPHKENMMSPEQVKRLFQRGYGGGLNMNTSLSEPKIVRASAIRVASLGDLTQFLKAAEGKLVHKATNDLWSYSKDADGNFLVERLFDDEGEPLKA